MSDKPVVFFDGVCNFCNFWVNFAIKRDKKKKLLFSPLQGLTAKKVLPRFELSFQELDSVLLLDENKIYTHSSAAIRICKYLGGGWKFFYGFMIIPKFLRDPVYRFIARNRYRWYGKKDSCMIPSPAIKERFLD